MANIEYYVNDKEGIVIAKCPDAVDELYQEAVRIWNRQTVEDFGVIIVVDEVMSTIDTWFKNNGGQMKSIIGKANCNTDAGDVFDVEYGKLLAKRRLEEKLAKFHMRFYSYVKNSINNLMQACSKYEKRSNEDLIYSQKRIAELLKNN